MPTGYTQKLMEKGQTFPEFTLLCARAMGACVMMCDDSMDTPIPERFEPSDYHVKELRAAKRKLTKLQRMTPAEQRLFGQTEKTRQIKMYRDWLAREERENARLEGMRVQVERWQPPTSDHGGLKEFMLEQIRISSNDPGYIKDGLAKAESNPPSHYYDMAIREAKRDVEYHTKEQAEEVKRTDGRNNWIKQLRASLANPQAAAEQ